MIRSDVQAGRRSPSSLHKRLPVKLRVQVEAAFRRPSPGMASVREVYEHFGLSEHGVTFGSTQRFATRVRRDPDPDPSLLTDCLDRLEDVVDRLERLAPPGLDRAGTGTLPFPGVLAAADGPSTAQRRPVERDGNGVAETD